MRRSRTRNQPAEEESFLVSSADLMACVLFVFILLAVVFAIKAEKTTQLATAAQARADELQRQWSDTTRERHRFLENLQFALRGKGIVVMVNQDDDGLLFPDGSLTFDQCSKELHSTDVEKLGIFAAELAPVLQKYSYRCGGGGRGTPTQAVDVVLIEGHTDKTRPAKGCGFLDNWALSAARAAATRDKLLNTNPALGTLCNARDRPMFAIAGYADQRPVNSEHDAGNRRIEFRFIMRPPSEQGQDHVDDRPTSR